MLNVFPRQEIFIHKTVKMKSTLLALGLITFCSLLKGQDTLTLFDPNTYEQTVYILNHDKGAVHDTPKKVRSNAECYLVTIGLTPVLISSGKAQSQLMTTTQLKSNLGTGIGVLTFDQCMEGQNQLGSYTVKVLYDESRVAEFSMTDFNNIRKDKPSLERLLLKARQVQIADITVQNEAGTIALPQITIKVEG